MSRVLACAGAAVAFSRWHCRRGPQPHRQFMGVESKPLFHPEVLRQQVRAFRLPERVTAALPRLNH